MVCQVLSVLGTVHAATIDELLDETEELIALDLLLDEPTELLLERLELSELLEVLVELAIELLFSELDLLLDESDDLNEELFILDGFIDDDIFELDNETVAEDADEVLKPQILPVTTGVSAAPPFLST
jgi:hypothetical protein